MEYVLSRHRIADVAGADRRPSRFGGRSLRSASLAITFVLPLLVGCTSTDAPSLGAPGVDPWYGGDISEHQRAVYEQWQETGLVSFSDYETAVDDNDACLEDAGFSIEDRRVVQFMGQPIVVARVRIPDSLVSGPNDTHLADAISSECADRYESLVKALYAMNPASQEYLDTLAEERRPYFLECLRSRGYNLPDTSTNNEIQQAMNDLFEIDPNIDDPNCIVVIKAE